MLDALLKNIHATSWQEFAAVALTILCVWQTARQSIWCWPTGIVSCALLVWVLLQANLRADAGLQVVYILLSVYGWIAWARGGGPRDTLPVSRVPLLTVLCLVPLSAATFAGLMWLLHQPGQSWTVCALDVGTTTASLAAQYLLTRKHIESWPLWIAVNITYVGLYVYKGLLLLALLQPVLMVLSIQGWLAWRRELLAQAEQAAAGDRTPAAP